MPKKTTKQADISTIFSPKKIASLVCEVRGEPVLLDADLAELHQFKTRVLKQAVRRNINRFPGDFMFELSAEEVDTIYVSRSQSVILKRGHNVKYMPFAFTEEGVAMLSSVLRSPTAVEVNIAIMRTFVQLRKLMDGNRELARKIKPWRNGMTNNSMWSSKRSSNCWKKTTRAKNHRSGRWGFKREFSAYPPIAQHTVNTLT
jgi:hypothetical protein